MKLHQNVLNLYYQQGYFFKTTLKRILVICHLTFQFQFLYNQGLNFITFPHPISKSHWKCLNQTCS